jgi:menaquinone-dependent protoporphyrinogen oxidase
MDKVLVAYASRMGSTKEVALAIGDQLTRRGFIVDVQPAATAENAGHYRAVILGSAVYLQHWDKDALRYLRSQAPELSEMPTWLFQSGPCDPETPTKDSTVPHAVAQLCFEIGLKRPMTFGGNLDPQLAKRWLERIVAHSELTGDFRDWDRIRAWTDQVADELIAERMPLSV